MDAEFLSHASRREVRSRLRGAGPELRSPSTGWAPAAALRPHAPGASSRAAGGIGPNLPVFAPCSSQHGTRTAPHVILSVPQAGGATSGAYRRSYRGGLARCLHGPAARTRRLGRLSHDGGGKRRPSGGCGAPERPHSRPTDTPCPGPAPREPRERRARRPHGAAHRYGNGRKARRAERKRREKTLRDSAFPANERAERRRG